VAPGRSVFLASSPGRTELAGNHTDHNQGKVLAASVQLDTIAAVSPRDDMRVTFASDGFPLVELDLGDLAVRKAERETTSALVRGVGAALQEAGWRIGGFDATVSSLVAAGSGLSSSASVEILVGTILDHGWNSDRIGPTAIALAGKVAENRYFGKPSGLMDQVACATGGVVSIDFKDNDNPIIERLDVDFTGAGLSLLVVHTGAGHADLTDEYAAIPAEMGAVARHFGSAVLAEVAEEDLLAELGTLRAALGDRAVARALHFYGETARVEQMVAALATRDFDRYLQLMSDSGRSSGIYLQNCAPATSSDEQAVVIALALTERFLNSAGLRFGREAACRVHGGGFAGTIQVLLPTDAVAAYRGFIEGALGERALTELEIRSTGAIAW
jgi:galactokinase